MQRGSDKHGTRVDEALGHDSQSIVQGQPVEARAEEHREQEGPGDGEPTPDVRLAGGRPLRSGHAGRPSRSGQAWPTDDEVEARAELARHLQPSDLPARPEQLRETAQRRHAPDWVVQRLGALPDGTYATTDEVWSALGGSRERRP